MDKYGLIEKREEAYRNGTASKFCSYCVKSEGDKRTVVDKGVLEKMYLIDRMSTAEIGRKLGVSNVTILRWLRKFGLYQKRDAYITKEELERLYCEERVPVRVILNKWKITRNRFYDKLREYGIPSRGNSRNRPKRKVTDKDEAEIVRMHVMEGMSAFKISKEMKLNRKTVCRALERNGVYMAYNKPDVDRDTLRRMHTEEGMSARMIALKLNVSWQYIANELKDMGIYEPQIGGHYIDLDCDLIRELYVGKGMSTYKIASMLGTSSTLIANRLHKMGVELNKNKDDSAKESGGCGNGYEDCDDGIEEMRSMLNLYRIAVDNSLKAESAEGKVV